MFTCVIYFKKSNFYVSFPLRKYFLNCKVVGFNFQKIYRNVIFYYCWIEKIKLYYIWWGFLCGFIFVIGRQFFFVFSSENTLFWWE